MKNIHEKYRKPAFWFPAATASPRMLRTESQPVVAENGNTLEICDEDIYETASELEFCAKKDRVDGEGIIRNATFDPPFYNSKQNG